MAKDSSIKQIMLHTREVLDKISTATTNKYIENKIEKPKCCTIHVSCKQEDVDWINQNELSPSKIFQNAVKERKDKCKK